MKRSELAFTLALVPLDYLALLAAATTAYFARFYPAFTEIRPVIFDLTFESYARVVSPMILVFLLVFAVAGLYSTRRTSIWSELNRVALACSASMAAVFAITFFSRTLFESRVIALVTWVLAIAFVGLMLSALW